VPAFRVMRTTGCLATLFLAVCVVVSAQDRVDVTTVNGMRFVAGWTSAGTNAPVALFFPMCWETPPETWAPVAAALKARGVSSLVTTYPGWRGNSPWPGPQPPPEPRNVYWAEQFRQVTDAAVAFVSARTTRPIAIAGSSCGVTRALDAAAHQPDRVAGVVVFAGAHAPAHVDYVKSRQVPVLAITSRGEREWVDQHPRLVSASGHTASRLIVREESGHGTALLKNRTDLSAEIADWIAARLSVGTQPR
jgi:pimeloyl-ACP methyl ester carboxylesterase